MRSGPKKKPLEITQLLEVQLCHGSFSMYRDPRVCFPENKIKLVCTYNVAGSVLGIREMGWTIE